MPPNLSKVFYHWGLEEKVRKLAMKSSAVAFKRRESSVVSHTNTKLNPSQSRIW